MKLLDLKITGDIENVKPWRDNLLHTVPDHMIHSHPYCERIVIIQEPIETLLYFDHRPDPLVVWSDAGYAFDYASIPTRTMARILRYNCRSLAHGARIHDIGFQLQYGGIHLQACLLREVSLFLGYSPWRMRIVEPAVKGNIAKRLYKDRNDFDIANSEFCRMGRVYG